MKWLAQAIFALSVVLPSSLQAQSTEILTNRNLGLEIAKPATWVNLSAEENSTNLRRVHGNDPELQTLIAKYATAPIFAFTKFQEPYSDLNPSIKISARPSANLAGKSGTEILAMMVPSLSKVFPDLKIEQSPQDTVLAGKPSSYARFSYTLVTDEGRYPTTSEMWIIPNGTYFYLIGAGTRQDEANGTRKDIHSILATLKIETED